MSVTTLVQMSNNLSTGNVRLESRGHEVRLAGGRISGMSAIPQLDDRG